MTREEQRHVKMTTTSVPGLILKLAVPTIASMLVTSLYNLADTFFVARISTSAVGAVNVIFPLMAIIQALGFMIGMGSGSRVSRLLGEKRNDEANRVASGAALMALLGGVILAVVCFSLGDGLMTALGASPTILPHANAYAQYILLGAPVMMCSYVFNNVLRAQGNATFAMIGIVSGAVLNVALDPLFIFVFRLGIAGAAIATVLSQLISMLILAFFFITKLSIVRIGVKWLTVRPGVYLNTLLTGLPSLCRQGLSSIAAVMLNRAAVEYGDSAIAAMGIVSKAAMIVFGIGLGIGQGYVPVLGYNYGDGRYTRVRRAFIFTLNISTAVLAVFACAGFFLAPWIMDSFIDYDPAAVEIGIAAMRMQMVSLPLVALGFMCNMTFQTTGRSLIATVLSCARQGIFFLPLVYILPRAFGLFGVEMVQAAADACTFIFCLPFMIWFLVTLPKEDSVKAER